MKDVLSVNGICFWTLPIFPKYHLLISHRYANYWCMHLFGHWTLSPLGILVMNIKCLPSPFFYLSGFTFNGFWSYYYCCSLYWMLWPGSLSCVLKRLSDLAIRIFLIEIFLAHDLSYIWMSIYSKSVYYDHTWTCYWIVCCSSHKSRHCDYLVFCSDVIAIATNF